MLVGVCLWVGDAVCLVFVVCCVLLAVVDDGVIGVC